MCNINATKQKIYFMKNNFKTCESYSNYDFRILILTSATKIIISTIQHYTINSNPIITLKSTVIIKIL